MQRIPQLRVIIETEPHSGAWNMAVDEALLETAISTDVATLRWYQWREPTVSLGYFQKSIDLIGDPVLSQLPAVRRLTGGGAILHDDELTHSVTLPSSQKLFEQPHQLYDIVHKSLIEGLCELGFPVDRRGETRKRSDEPLLCFQREDAHDITLRGCKVLGSAQRRRRGAILQHGSLIRKASPLAKQLRGLTDLCSVDVPADLAQAMGIRVADAIADSWKMGVLTDHEIETAQRLCQQDCTNVRHR